MSWVAEHDDRFVDRIRLTIEHAAACRKETRLGDGVDAIGGMTGKPRRAEQQPLHRARLPGSADASLADKDKGDEP
jgi:hypothetical protein